MMSERATTEVEELRADVNALVQVNAGLLDAVKYLIRHGPYDTDQAEQKRQGAESKFKKRFLIL